MNPRTRIFGDRVRPHAAHSEGSELLRCDCRWPDEPSAARVFMAKVFAWCALGALLTIVVFGCCGLAEAGR